MASRPKRCNSVARQQPSEPCDTDVTLVNPLNQNEVVRSPARVKTEVDRLTTVCSVGQLVPCCRDCHYEVSPDGPLTTHSPTSTKIPESPDQGIAPAPRERQSQREEAQGNGTRLRHP